MRKLFLALAVMALMLTGAGYWPKTSAQIQMGIPFRCVVTVSTATTLTAVGGDCTSHNAQSSFYVTDILFSANAGGIAADSFNTLKYGTGTACGTGTTIFWGDMATAATQQTAVQDLTTPSVIPPGNDICWINSTAGSKFLVLNGFIR